MTKHEGQKPEKPEVEHNAAGEADAPEGGSALRLRQQVSDALAETPGGEALGRYFGLDGQTPGQSSDEAQRSDALLSALQAAQDGEGDIASALTEITEHNSASGADPDALRALMRRASREDEPPTEH